MTSQHMSKGATLLLAVFLHALTIDSVWVREPCAGQLTEGWIARSTDEEKQNIPRKLIMNNRLKRTTGAWDGSKR